MNGEEIQKQILKKFMYNSNLKYSELWDKTIPSNKFNYHLQQLINRDIVIKKSNGYELTDNGIHAISSLDGVAIKDKKKPILCVFIMGFDDKTNKILVNIRKKQPLFNYLGIPGGKVEFGKTLLEQAKEEFLEETGLEGDLDLKLIMNLITMNEDTEKTQHHVTGFFYLAKNLRGKLIDSNREGENIFMSLDETEKYPKYPDFEFFTKKLLEETKTITFQEAKRYVKDNKFTKIEFHQN